MIHTTDYFEVISRYPLEIFNGITYVQLFSTDYVQYIEFVSQINNFIAVSTGDGTATLHALVGRVKQGELVLAGIWSSSTSISELQEKIAEFLLQIIIDGKQGSFDVGVFTSRRFIDGHVKFIGQFAT